MRKDYDAPAFRELGSLVELTEQNFNKVGTAPDIVTVTNQNVVGSFVAVP